MNEEEIDHEYTDEIVCPYCGYEFSDSFEISSEEEDLGLIECDVVLRFPAVHQGIQRLTDAVGKLGLPPLLAAFPQKGQKQNSRSQTNRRRAQKRGWELQESQQDQQDRSRNYKKGHLRRAVPLHSWAPVQT